MKPLFSLKCLYGTEKFVIACYNDKYDQVIHPKTVSIKSDLTVWHNGSCIINGMTDALFLHNKNCNSSGINELKNELFLIIESKNHLTNKQKAELKNKIKKRL